MFNGSMVALVTPMSDDASSVNTEKLRELVEFHISQGTSAIIAAGTTGEAGTLTQEEIKLVISTVIDQTKHRVPVIAGTSANSTQRTIELTHMAMELGADAALIMTPYYIKPTQEGLFLHYQAIANKVPIPIILYNVPGRTACDMLPETVERLSHISNIIGIKEATGKLNRAIEIASRCGENIDIYSGDDFVTKDLILLGGKGVISVTANIAPRMVADLCSYALAKEENMANDLNEKLSPLNQALFLETNPIPVKWALWRLGMIGEGIRLPLTKLSAQYHDQVQQAMNQLGLM